MNISKFKLLALIAGFLFIIQAFSQQPVDLSKYNCFSAPVKYFMDGKQTEGLLLFINHTDKEMAMLHYTNVYLLNKSGQNIQLVPDSNAFIGVYGVKTSNSYKYLAIYRVGEGHPWIELYDLQKLINEQTQELLADINPYPGNVDLIGWQNDKLIVESDINLILKNDGKELSDKDIFQKSRKFLFDLDTKKYKEYK